MPDNTAVKHRLKLCKYQNVLTKCFYCHTKDARGEGVGIAAISNRGVDVLLMVQ